MRAAIRSAAASPVSSSTSRAASISPTTCAELGRYYRDYVELMAHMDEVLPGRVHRVIYETHGRRTLRPRCVGLLAYCGLPFNEECLRFYATSEPYVPRARSRCGDRYLRDAVEQWRNFEPWLAPLKAALGPVLEAYPATPLFQSTAR